MISGIIFSVSIIAVIYIVFVVAPQKELQAKERILKQVIELCDKNGLDQSNEDKKQTINTALDLLGFPNPKDKDKDKDNDK